MDTLEQCAETMLHAVQMYVDKKLAPLVQTVDDMKKELARGFLTQAAAEQLFVTAEGVDVRLQLVRDEVRGLSEGVGKLPTLELVRAEQSGIAAKAAAEAFATLPIPKDGRSVTLDDVRPILAEMVAAIPRPANGKDADPEFVRAEVKKAVDAIPKPNDGVDGAKGEKGDPGEPGPAGERGEPGPPGDRGEKGDQGDIGEIGPQGEIGPVGERGEKGIDGERGEAGSPGPEGQRGLQGAAGEIGLAGPAGATGERGERGEKGADGLMGPNGPAGERGEKGIDGVAGADGKDADIKTITEIVGISVKAALAELPRPERGADGKDADPLDMDEVERIVRRRVEDELATWPKPTDGVDGLGFDDMSADIKDDGRTIVLRFAKDGREKAFEFFFPCQIYRGAYKSGTAYSAGDVVTYGGAQFTARRDTKARPETPAAGDDWQLSVKSGKDGNGS